MASPNKQTLLRDMRAARAELLKAIDSLDPHTPLTADGWRLHDVIGHIASWDREALAAVQAFIGDDEPYLIDDYSSVDEWNDAQMERKAGWPPAQVRMDFHMVRRELENLLDKFDDETLQTEIPFPWHKRGTIYRLFEIVCVEHDREHAELIRAWRLAHENGRAK